MENILKIKVFRKSILFCKYLRNKSSELHENFYVCLLISLEFLNFMKIRSQMRARDVNVRTRDKTCARTLTTCVRAFIDESS